MSLFSNIIEAPADPILGVVERFNQDTRAEKVNLSIGVYTNDNGKVPTLRAVQAAREYLVTHAMSRTYLPMDGLSKYNRAVQALLLGEMHPLLQTESVSTIQSLGGTGALKIAADFLHTLLPESHVYVSNPTWDNHRAIFSGAGFIVEDYPYFDETTGGVAFASMLDFLTKVPAQSIIILHTCCHNPTGADLTVKEWTTLAQLFADKGLVPILDMAYQGFSKGVKEDAEPINIFVQAGVNVLIANSFSKSFSLYGERIGALSVTTNSAKEARAITSHLKQMVRANYSSPPLTGAEVVATVLTNPEWCQLWQQELQEMQMRIKSMRHQLVEKLNNGQDKKDFSFVNQQAGMFSYSGLTPLQVERLKTEHAIYAVKTGRICVAALNTHNIDTVVKAILQVL